MSIVCTTERTSPVIFVLFVFRIAVGYQYPTLLRVTIVIHVNLGPNSPHKLMR